jgi:hypothetical protein
MASKYEIQLGRLIDLNGLPAPEKEYLFCRHLGRLYRWDFAWPWAKVALEADGGRFTGRGRGRPVTGAPIGYHGSDEDNRKRNIGNLLGWKILIYSPAMISSGEAIEDARIALAQAQGQPWEDRLLAHVRAVFDRGALQRKVARNKREFRAQRGGRLGYVPPKDLEDINRAAKKILG